MSPASPVLVPDNALAHRVGRQVAGHRIPVLERTALATWVRQLLMWTWALAGVLGLWPAHAHLMVAQKGTLNLTPEGAYLVLSLPASAFEGVDDDGDGRLSLAELRAHAPSLDAQVQRGVRLSTGGAVRPLEGLMLSLSPPDDQPAAPASQLVVLGRFAPASVAGTSWLEVRLFGQSPQERRLEVVASQAVVGQPPGSPAPPGGRAANEQMQRLQFERGRERLALMPGMLEVLADHLELGFSHVLGGLDHLLFLLVVVAAGGGARYLLAALTCFTLGHALTLVAVVLGGWTVPSTWVEPAITVTIVVLAVFDARGRLRPGAGRLVLVFACALIHGLGLAEALVGLRLDDQHLWPSLVGFNLGVEAGQVLVAMPSLGLLALLKFRCGEAADWRVRQGSRAVALACGLVWLLARVV